MVSKWAVKLNFSGVSRRRQTWHIKRIKLKGIRPCRLRTMAEKAVKPLSGLRSSGIS